MSLTAVTEDGIASVGIGAKALDASNAGAFKAAMAPIIADSDRVVLDFTHVRFVDSSGLGAILSCMRQLRAKGGDVKVCCVARPVQALFELVRFHRILDIVDTREEAKLAFGE